MGFKNARKCTSYAAEAAAEKLAGDARKLGIGQVRCSGAGLHQKIVQRPANLYVEQIES